MGIAHEYIEGPIMSNNYLIYYKAYGKIADGSTNEWPWQGDRLVIWDEDTKEVKWTWSTFDHFSMNDYDENQWDSQPHPNGYFDWTHVNAFYYDERNGNIYISTRNLSRITKINIQYDAAADDITGGEVIWNMGHDYPSGDVEFGHNLGFSQQHSISLSTDDNILILDNGNYSVAYLGTSEKTTRALEISVTESQGTYSSNIVWEYALPTNLFGSQAGNVQQLHNGNYLITTIGDNGNSFEVSSEGDLIWEANYSSALLWRANRIEEIFSDQINLFVHNSHSIITDFKIIDPYPNPFNPIVNIDYELDLYNYLNINITNLNGQMVQTIFSGFQHPGHYFLSWDAASYPSGMYLINIENENKLYTRKVILIK